MVADAVEAHSNLVRAMDDRKILTGRKALIVSKRGNPRAVIAQIRIPGNQEGWKAAVIGIFAVRPGDAEDICTPILAMVSSQSRMAVASKSIRRVVQLICAKAVCVSNGRQIYTRISGSCA